MNFIKHLVWVIFLGGIITGAIGATSGSTLITNDRNELILHVAANPVDWVEAKGQIWFQTWPDAQSKIRSLITDGLKQNIRVLFHGQCFLTETMKLEIADSPPDGYFITYASANQADPSLISSASKIEGWHELESGLWATEIPVDSNWSGESNNQKASLPMRQLFLGTQRLHRARSPNAGYFRVAAPGADQRTSLTIDPLDWQPNGAGEGIELVYLHDWSVSRVTVRSYEPGSHLLSFANRIGAPHDFFRIGGFEDHARYFVENAREFLDEPLEFFHDVQNNTLLIRLPVNQSPADTPIFLPQLDQLVVIHGSAEKPVRGLKFEGLKFQHTRCSIPASGYAGIQAGYFENRESGSEGVSDATTESGHRHLPGAVQTKFVSDCQFKDCEWSQLGGDAIHLDQQTNHTEIVSCLIDDVGCCGMRIGETISRDLETNNLSTCHQIQVRDCRVTRCGQVLAGSVGIWIGIAREVEVSGTEIMDLPYSGISIGWRWDSQPSACQGNRIVNNDIHRVMQILSDGGGIYTLGLQPGTTIRENRIHDIPLNVGRAESNGIFMDEGSSEIVVADNQIYRTARSPIRFHKVGTNRILENELFIESGQDTFTFNSTDPKILEFLQNRILKNSDAPK